MTHDTARALKRRLATAQAAEAAGIEAALRAGGYDPATVEPDEPEGYLEQACSDARAYNPAYLSYPELVASIEAREAAMGGLPF